MLFSKYFSRDGFTIREAQDEDIHSMVELINHAFAYQDEAKGDVRIDISGIRRKQESSTFYVIRNNRGQLAACFYVKVLTITLYFGLLSVADEYRKTGLAVEIITSLETYARKSSLTILRLDYMSLSPWLEAYYNRYGYVRSGIVRDIGWAQLIRMEKLLI